MIKNLTLGCDPEIFLQDASGALIASCDRIGGSKSYPRPLPIGDGYAVQEDNVAIEFNIPPADSPETLRDSVNKAITYLRELVQEQGLFFSKLSAVEFPKEQLWHPHALEFGCDPDFNAWENGKRNPRPKADNDALRSCGGHVHIGYKFDTKRELIEFIKYMDLYLGVGSVLLDEGELRKQLYGKAGCFRFKPYGGEYRTLSNFWIFDDKLIDWVWNSTEAAMDAWQNNNRKFRFADNTDKLVQDAINTNNKHIAEQLIKQHNIQLA